MTQNATKHPDGPSPHLPSLAGMVAVCQPPQATQRLGQETYLKIAILGALFAIVNYWQWPILVPAWLKDADWQHGMIIPFFSLYLLYARRHVLLQAPRKGCWWGLVIVVAAMLMNMLGFYPLGVYYICHVAMVFLLFGLVLLVAGTKVIRVVWLPILYWLFAMPLPKLLYNNIAFPLQNLAAGGSMLLLQVLGIDITAVGSTLNGVSQANTPFALEIIDACSGIHSLMAYLALGVAMTYLEDRPNWQRVTLVLCIIPVALFTNILRVAITAIMYYIDRPELGDKFMHTLTGMLMLVPTCLMLWAISWTLKRIFVEVEEEAPKEGAMS